MGDMQYEFMLSDGKLFRVDYASGKAWYADHNTWVLIEEPTIGHR